MVLFMCIFPAKGEEAAGSSGDDDPTPMVEPTGSRRDRVLREVLFLRRPQGEEHVLAGVLWAGRPDMTEISAQEFFNYWPMVAIDYFLAQLGVSVPSPLDTTSWPIGGILKARYRADPKHPEGCREFFAQWRHPGRRSAADPWLLAKDVRGHVPEGPWLLAEFAKTPNSGPVFWPAPQGKPRRIISLLFDAGRAMARLKVAEGALHALPVSQLAHEVVAGSSIRFVVEGEDGLETLKDLATMRGDWPMLVLAYFHKEFFGIPFDL
jgi:hypothetical protein